MLTKRIRWQLSIFAALTAISMYIIADKYLDLVDMLGFGHHEISVELVDATGLYAGGTVTYRGVDVGQIDRLELGTGQTAVAVVELSNDAQIPADATAQAHSSSAIGENYIELTTSSTDGPLIAPGSVIRAANTTGIQPTGDLLERVTALADSIPEDSTRVVLDEVAAAFSGADEDFGVLVKSAAELTAAARTDLPAIEAMFDELVPFLTTQQKIAPDGKQSLKSLAAFTKSVDGDEKTFNSLLTRTPKLTQAIDGLVGDIESDVPVLLADLLSVSEVARVYQAGIEQILVIYPGVMASIQSASTHNTAPASIHLGARLTVNNPPNCYEGFMPIANQREFGDETRRDSIPDDLYCKVAPNDPRAVRGARNSPCFNVPGRRAASVEQCLGREIGTVDDPLRKSSRYSLAYDPKTATSTADVPTWQQLVMR